MALKTFSDTLAVRFEFLSSKYRVTPRFNYRPIPAAAPDIELVLQARHLEFDSGQAGVDIMAEKPSSATSRFMKKIVRLVLLFAGP